VDDVRGVLLCLFVLVAGAGSAQELPTGVTVSATAGVPGAEVTTPVYLASAKEAKPGAITLSLSFPSHLLTFRKVESDLADAFGFTVATALKTRDEGSTTVLDVDIRYKEADGKVIPDGPVARLTFEISATATMNTAITLHAAVVGTTTDVPPKPLTPVKAYDGKIDVTGEAVFACFFYMH
jgi:hypothetical protein